LKELIFLPAPDESNRSQSSTRKNKQTTPHKKPQQLQPQQRQQSKAIISKKIDFFWTDG